MSYAHSRHLAGYLKKKGLGGWKTRFCILSETVLFYFKKEEDASPTAAAKGEKPEGALNCLGCAVYKEADPTFAFSVELAPSKKTAIFQAPTAEDAEAWIRELKRASGRVVYTLDNPAEFHKADQAAEGAVQIHSEGQRSAEEESRSVALHYDFDEEPTETVMPKSIERSSSHVDLDSDSEAEDQFQQAVEGATKGAGPSSSPTGTSSTLHTSSSFHGSSSSARSSFSLNSPSQMSIDSEDDPPPPPPFEPDPELSPQSRRRALLANAPSREAPPRNKSVAPKSPKILPSNPKIPFLSAPERAAPRLPEKKPTLAQLERNAAGVQTPVDDDSAPNFVAAARLAGMIKQPRISVHSSDSDIANMRKNSLPVTSTLPPGIPRHTRSSSLSAISPSSPALSINADGSNKGGDSPMITPKGGDFIAPRRGRPPPSPRVAGGSSTPTHSISPTHITVGSPDDIPPPPIDSEDEAPPPPALQIELSTTAPTPISPQPGLTSPAPGLSPMSTASSPEAVNIHASRPVLPKFTGLSPPPLPAFSGAPLPSTPASVNSTTPSHTPSPTILTLRHRSASSAIVAEASEKGLFKQLLAKPPPRRRSFRYPDSSYTPPPLSSSDPSRPSPPSQVRLPPRTEAGPLPTGPQILPHRMSRSSMVIHIDDRRLSRGSVSRGGIYAGYCKILKGRLRKKWENRYFTLDVQGRSLMYRESWDSQLPQKRRMISLVNAHVSAVERFREHGYCWMIQTPRRSYFICAFTPEDQMEWVRAITSLLHPDPNEPFDDEPVPIDIEQFRPSPPPSNLQLEHVDEEDDPIVTSWLAWEATQKELEYQRELTLFLLEINQDDFTGRQRRQVKFTKGENLMAPKLLFETPPSEGKPPALKGEFCFTAELAKALTAQLDSGKMVWVHATGGVLQYSVEGEALVDEPNLQAAYELLCPPGQTNTNFDVVGAHFLNLETTRHQAAQKLLSQTPQEVGFAALLCRHLRRPEDGVRRAATGSSLAWMSSGHAADALFSLQTLFGWLVSNQVLRSDLCSVWDVVTKGVPPLDSLYNQCFGISVVAGMKHVEDRRFFSHSQRPEPAEKKEPAATPPRTRDSTTSLIDPSKITFQENGVAVKEAQAATKISQALQMGLFVVFALTKHRGVEFLIECREDALDLREAWTRWKAPFEKVQPHCIGEIYPRIVPAWTAIERARYEAQVSNITLLFAQCPVMVLSRFMQQSPDMVKPPVFGDVLLRWLPPQQGRVPRDDDQGPPLAWHNNRLMDWLADNQVVGNYTVQISSLKKVELPSYDRMYHQLFLAAPTMFTSLSSVSIPYARPPPNATLSTRSVFAEVLRTPPACFAAYLVAPADTDATPSTTTTTGTTTSSISSSRCSSSSSLVSLGNAAESPHGGASGKLTPRGSVNPGTSPSGFTTPKPGAKVTSKVKRQVVEQSEDSSDSGDEGYHSPAERAWAEGRLTTAFAAFPNSEAPMDKEQIMGICIELATDGLQEAETSRFVSLLTGGECPSLGAMLYDFVDKTGGHEATDSELDEGDEEEIAPEVPLNEVPRTNTLAEF